MNSSSLYSSRRTSALLLAGSFALAASCFAPGAARAQQTPAGQTGYTGVSHPPADDVITANGDDESSTPRAQKPSPATAQASPQPSAPDTADRTALVSSAPAGQNPDYGIVTTAQAPAPRSAASSSEAELHLVTRKPNPDYGIVTVVPSPTNELAEGTNLRVRLVSDLSTKENSVGEPFRAQVAHDVYKEGRVVIPVGSELRGRIVQVTHGHRLGARATLRLRPDAVILPDGTAYHLYAQAISAEQPGVRTDSEGGIQNRMHLAKDAAEYGVGAGGGAILGASLGGPVGAGAGALVGAGLVTTHLLLQRPAQTHLDSGTEIVFSLTEPMELMPTRN